MKDQIAAALVTHSVNLIPHHMKRLPRCRGRLFNAFLQLGFSGLGWFFLTLTAEKGKCLREKGLSIVWVSASASFVWELQEVEALFFLHRKKNQFCI